MVEFTAKLIEIAPACGLTAASAPSRNSLMDAVTGRHWPSPPTMLLVRHATDGAVDLEHWVRDLHS